MKSKRTAILCALAIAAIPVLGATSAWAGTGTLTVTSKSIAIGVGVSWGEGTLEYKGRTHKVKVKGLSVVDLGMSNVTAVGEVTNLNKLEDFSGNFTAVAAAATMGGGAGAQKMRNQNGVEISM